MGFSQMGLAALAGVLTFAAADRAAAQAQGFDPAAACGATLRAAQDTDKMMIAAWVAGQRFGSGGEAAPVDMAMVHAVLTELIQICLKDEKASLAALVAPEPPPEPGSEADAIALLNRFMQHGANRVAMTAQLQPTDADIAAVYAEPLAGKLQAMYAQMYNAKAQIGPKPDQNALLTVMATTAELKHGDPVLREFPGGYDKVRPYMIGNHPIVRFKFVKQGESTGLAFDGLIHVNGHWVLMPKPWRALE